MFFLIGSHLGSYAQTERVSNIVAEQKSVCLNESEQKKIR